MIIFSFLDYDSIFIKFIRFISSFRSFNNNSLLPWIYFKFINHLRNFSIWLYSLYPLCNAHNTKQMVILFSLWNDYLSRMPNYCSHIYVVVGQSKRSKLAEEMMPRLWQAQAVVCSKYCNWAPSDIFKHTCLDWWRRVCLGGKACQ